MLREALTVMLSNLPSLFLSRYLIYNDDEKVGLHQSSEIKCY